MLDILSVPFLWDMHFDAMTFKNYDVLFDVMKYFFTYQLLFSSAVPPGSGDFKGYFQGQKGLILTFVIYLGQYLRNGACCVPLT